MEELTREEAIRRHRLMWNWLAKKGEKGKVVEKKDAFEHFGWTTWDVVALCWCCEYAANSWAKDETDEKHSFCDFCPLDWSNGKNEAIKANCSKISIHDGRKYPGLYDLWYDSITTDFAKSSKLARIIANLPEKKEVKEHD